MSRPLPGRPLIASETRLRVFNQTANLGGDKFVFLPSCDGAELTCEMIEPCDLVF